MDRVAHFACLALTALLTGTMFGAVPYSRAMVMLPGAGYALVQGHVGRFFHATLIFLMPLTILSSMPVMWAVYRAEVQPSFHFVAVATGLACTVAFVITTLLVNAPIEREVASWKPTAIPATYIQYRERWNRAHTIRAVFGLGALVAQIAGVV